MRPNLLLCLILLGVLPAVAQENLTPDAVTSATTLNPVIGEVAWLFDGRTPDNDPSAGAVEWGGAGLLRAAWPHPVALARIRAYIGLMERYGVYAYLGGSFSDTGQRVEVEEPVWNRQGLAPLDSNLWFEIPCRPEIPIDNIGLSMAGRTVLYEVQFLGPDGTVVAPASFGLIKATAGR